MTSAFVANSRRWASLAYYVVRRFRADSAFNMASSLSYTSLLSLVPLLAIGLAILAAFPVFDSVRDQLQVTLFRYVVPEVGEQIQSYVAGFVMNAGKLTAAGVVGLAFSAVMVLVSIESSLNQIFRVTTPRSPLSRLLVYWTALTLGPLMLGASFSLSAVFFAGNDWANIAGPWGRLHLVAKAVPAILLMAAFGLLYLTVPNRRVRPADAVIGGIAAGLAFAVLRWGFGLYVSDVHSYQSIYGAVASVPIFLFWMYLSWMAILFGAELTAALPEWRLSRESLGGPQPARRQLILALSLLDALFLESKVSGRGCGRVELLDRTGEAEGELLAVLIRLCDGGFIAKAETGRYVLGRDLRVATLADIVRLLDLGLASGGAEMRGASWMEFITGRLNEVAQTEATALDLPLNTILEAGDQSPHYRFKDGLARQTATRPS